MGKPLIRPKRRPQSNYLLNTRKLWYSPEEKKTQVPQCLCCPDNTPNPLVFPPPFGTFSFRQTQTQTQTPDFQARRPLALLACTVVHPKNRSRPVDLDLYVYTVVHVRPLSFNASPSGYSGLIRVLRMPWSEPACMTAESSDQ